VYLRIDISSPLHAMIVGALDLPELTQAITIQGDRAFVIDISDPASPAVIGNVEIHGNPLGIALADRSLVIAAGHQSLNYAPYDCPELSEMPPAVPHLRLDMSVTNPAMGHAVIRLSSPEASRVTIEILDPGGRVVRRLFDRNLPGGLSRLVWDLRDDRGRSLPAGTYFMRLGVDQIRRTCRFVVPR
jgi:hypothetical protein